MLVEYNLNNTKLGRTKVNIIYSKNQTLSKVTIINGTRFRINYPYSLTNSLTNSLTSNALTVKKVKFGDPNKINSPKNPIKNFNSLALNIKKVKVANNPIEKKSSEKNLFSPKNNNFNNKNNPSEHQASILLQKKANEDRINLLKKLNEDKRNLQLNIVNGKNNIFF